MQKGQHGLRDGGHTKDVRLENGTDIYQRGSGQKILWDSLLKSAASLAARAVLLQVTDPKQHNHILLGEALRDLKSDPLIGPGNQGDAFLLHALSFMPRPLSLLCWKVGTVFHLDVHGTVPRTRAFCEEREEAVT